MFPGDGRGIGFVSVNIVVTVVELIVELDPTVVVSGRVVDERTVGVVVVGAVDGILFVEVNTVVG
jgi:hypothetical protein